MTQSTHDIAALIGSRICHDLISPVGAVANGLELVELTGMRNTPEMALVSESAEQAGARIKFFRLAFGMAQPGQKTAAEEVAGIIAAVYAQGRMEVRWEVTGEQERQEVKAALLALLCIEQALPGAGRITVQMADGRWRVRAEAPVFKPDPELWAVLEGALPPAGLQPSGVQFALLPGLLAEAGRQARVQTGETVLEVEF